MPILIPTAPVLKTFVDDFTSIGGTPQAITGLGFKPKAIIFIAIEGTGGYTAISWGFDDSVYHRCVKKMDGANPYEFSREYSIYVTMDPSNILRGYISSMDADGFTITWDLAGNVLVDVFFKAIG